MPKKGERLWVKRLSKIWRLRLGFGLLGCAVGPPRQVRVWASMMRLISLVMVIFCSRLGVC